MIDKRTAETWGMSPAELESFVESATHLMNRLGTQIEDEGYGAILIAAVGFALSIVEQVEGEKTREEKKQRILDTMDLFNGSLLLMPSEFKHSMRYGQKES